MPSLHPYLDDSGSPRLRLSIVGFLDLLGFSQMALSQTDPDEALQLLHRLSAAIADSRRYVRNILAEEFSATSTTGIVKFFSDNLVVGTPCDAEDVNSETAAAFVVRCAQRYQLRMTLNGLFLRGGLTVGPVCLTDDIVFGASLIESYQLESHTAIVPRIVLSTRLRDLAIPALATAKSPLAHSQSMLCRDIDGWWFVNYLQSATTPEGRLDWAMISQHKASVMAATAGVTRHDVLPKFGWVSRYHNLFCHWHRHLPGFSPEVLIPRHDEESTIQRIEDISDPATPATR